MRVYCVRLILVAYFIPVPFLIGEPEGVRFIAVLGLNRDPRLEIGAAVMLLEFDRARIGVRAAAVGVCGGSTLFSSSSSDSSNRAHEFGEWGKPANPSLNTEPLSVRAFLLSRGGEIAAVVVVTDEDADGVMMSIDVFVFASCRSAVTVDFDTAGRFRDEPARDGEAAGDAEREAVGEADVMTGREVAAAITDATTLTTGSIGGTTAAGGPD